MNTYFSNKVIVITGASSGIGRELAIQMAANGTHLVLAARRLEELNQTIYDCNLKGATCKGLFLDVSDENSIQAFSQSIQQMFDHIDILVNNAGISQRSQAEETSLAVDRRIMEVNFFGQVSLTKKLWSLLCNSTHANIVLLSSVVGTFGFPQRSAYSASKHALEGFFESWSLENKKTNIHFTTVSPGRIKTNISLSALKADGSAHQVMDDGQLKGIPVETCVRKIVAGIQKNKRKIYIVQGEIVLITLRKVIPPMYFWLVKKLKLA